MLLTITVTFSWDTNNEKCLLVAFIILFSHAALSLAI